jgi:hypothetical protein
MRSCQKCNKITCVCKDIKEQEIRAKIKKLELTQQNVLRLQEEILRDIMR